MGGWKDDEVRGQESVEGEYENQKAEKAEGVEGLKHSSRARG